MSQEGQKVVLSKSAVFGFYRKTGDTNSWHVSLNVDGSASQVRNVLLGKI